MASSQFDITRLQSIRSFKQQNIPEEVLKTILEAGRHTPTAHNVQPWHFIVVTDPEPKKVLAANAKFIENAATVIVGCGDPSESPKWYELEVAIALQTMVVTAWMNGIGACWVDVSPNEEKVRAQLGIPHNLKMVASVAFGYPDILPKPSWKRHLEELVHYNKF